MDPRNLESMRPCLLIAYNTNPKINESKSKQHTYKANKTYGLNTVLMDIGRAKDNVTHKK